MSSAQDLDYDYWHKRWEKEETKWTVDEIKNNQHLHQLEWSEQHGMKPGTVFIPLCGDSIVIDVLVEKGYTVIGSEFSPIPIQDVLKRLGGTERYKRQDLDDGRVTFTRDDGKLTMVQGDFFLYKNDEGVDYVWDRNSLVAIDLTKRSQYMQVLHNALKTDGKIFAVVYERPDTKGPPFVVTEEQLARLCFGESTNPNAPANTGVRFDKLARQEAGANEQAGTRVWYALQKPRPAQAMMGGFTEQDVKDPEVLEHAKYAVQEINSKSHEQYELVEVTHAATQVVAGINYKLQLKLQRKGTNAVEQHDVTVYNQFGQKSLSQHQHSGAHDVKSGDEAPRRLLGGFGERSVDDEGVVAAAQFALTQVNMKSNSMFPFRLVKVIKAHSQVVAGINYKLELELARVSAPNGPERHEVHHVTVYDRFGDKLLSEHESPAQLQAAADGKDSTEEHVIGGYKRADVTSDGVVQAAQFALESINGLSGAKKFKLDKVMDAQTQLVAGMNYRLVLLVTDVTSQISEKHTVVVYDQFGTRSLSSHNVDVVHN